MADKTHATGAAGKAPTADQPDHVRNVVLVGHSGAGKTTLVEALLAATGTIQRQGRVEDGTTVSDFDEVEVRQQRSVNLTLVPFEHAGVKVNLLDTPGYADFIGDLRAGLRAADAALFVVSAADGVDGLTRMLWEECAAVGMPRAVVITKLDKERGRLRRGARACQRRVRRRRAPRSTCRWRPTTAARRPDRPAVPALLRLLGRHAAPSATPTPSTLPLIEAPRTRSSRRSSPSPRTRASWTATWPARTSTSRC